MRDQLPCFKKNTSLYIRAKFFRSEMPQSIYLRNWLIPSHLSVSLLTTRGVMGKRKSRESCTKTQNDWGQVSLRNTMKQDWLNICLLFYCHKTLADANDPVAITKTFASANNKSLFKTRNKVRGRLNWDISFFLSALIPPPPMEGYPM